MATNLRKTALHPLHKALKAKMAGFGGWDMPISYEGVIAEHKTVREHCGLFDVSHMGEILVSGPDAFAFLQYHTINDLGRLKPGQGQYSAFPNEEAGFVDDLILYQLAEQRYLLCVNASNIEKDFQWLVSRKGAFQVSLENASEAFAQIAVQGPESMPCLKAILSEADQRKLDAMHYMDIVEMSLFGDKVLIARTGYTGEWGYEIYLPVLLAEKTFTALMESGGKPIGLGARDTLRLEACYLLYGSDMDDTVSPFEAGIAWAIRFEKPQFLGKAKLEAQKNGSLPARKMIAFRLEEEGIARHDMALYRGDRMIGKVTSASFLPSLGFAGGMALIERDGGQIGDSIEIDIRGKRKVAKIVKRPLYSAQTKERA